MAAVIDANRWHLSDFPRATYGHDLTVYSDILRVVRRHWPGNGRLRQLRAILAEAEGRRITRSTFRAIQTRLTDL